MAIKTGCLALMLLAGVAYAQTGSSPAPQNTPPSQATEAKADAKIDVLKKQYEEAYNQCEACTVGRKQISQTSDCRKLCDKAKKLRKKVNKASPESKSEKK